MWGELERAVWSTCVAQALFKALSPKVLIVVNVYTGNENHYLEAEQCAQDKIWKLINGN